MSAPDLGDEARQAKTWHEYAHPSADELADWLVVIPRADLVIMAARFTDAIEHRTYCRADDLREEIATLTAQRDGVIALLRIANESACEDWDAHNAACEMDDTDAANIHGAEAEVWDFVSSHLRALLAETTASEERA